MTDNTPQTEYDSPWKQILQLYFADFMLFFFPQAHREIDWSRGFEFLDKELAQVVRDAELGRRLADKLVKVYRTGGDEVWVLVHLEIQSQEESDFSERMYTYNYRIYDRYKRSVASLAVLGDERVNWRPNQFGYELFGCRVNFQFPVIKLLDYQQRLPELEANRNPFATVVMAHLAALQTRSDRLQRKQQKLALVRRLYEQGLERSDIINLFGFIDWVMTLPAQLEAEFWQEYRDFEASKSMQYVTSVERFGIQKGKQEGLLKGISLGLKLKFGSLGQDLLPEIEQIEDVSLLESILEAIDTSDTVDELRSFYQSATDTQSEN
ncbi:cytosolic protein [Komarekiella sp. 'clone 1']|uniref:Cytosolic protein n=1 Tax=Komarekiella delphini-convector SJRDD-AB1 TaxID=2593771 RepID=A0AA40T4L6_9NOST|nr:cytosolic protein [Komarekiella delphini-convector]MBD6620843.1 cytosolic protein [Komarekiella delphini-convector SJRDD-AB1]